MIDPREALRPFARAADNYEKSVATANQADLDQAKCSSTVAILREPIEDAARVSVSMGDCRRARSVLAALSTISVDATLVKALEEIMKEVGTSTKAHMIARTALGVDPYKLGIRSIKATAPFDPEAQAIMRGAKRDEE